jgi:hypothetical protein
MYDILVLRFPLSGTTSVELAQNIVQQSFEQWEEQPTFISRTLTTKDTQIFIPKDFFPPASPETEIRNTEEPPIVAPPPPSKDLIIFWVSLVLFFIICSTITGFLFGKAQIPSASFKAMVPKGLSLHANGKAFSEISNQDLDRELTLEILQDETILSETKLYMEPNQNLIIILPLETPSHNPSP